MGLFVIIPLLAAAALVVGLFVHAVRADPGNGHRWLVVVPLLIFAGWLVVQLIMG